MEVKLTLSLPVAAQSTVWVCGRSLPGIAGSNSASNMDVFLFSVLHVVQVAVSCDGLITRPEESYRMCCVSECNFETSAMRRPRLTGAVEPGKKKLYA
jgi:hypothetical protein